MSEPVRMRASADRPAGALLPTGVRAGVEPGGISRRRFVRLASAGVTTAALAGVAMMLSRRAPFLTVACAQEGADGTESSAIPALSAQDVVASERTPGRETALTLLRAAISELREDVPEFAGTGVTVAEMRLAFQDLLDDPELYFVSGNVSMLYEQTSDDVTACPVNTVTLQYTVGADELPSYADALERGVASALSWVGDAMGDVEAAKALHDYLIRSTSYDTQAAEAAEADGTDDGGTGTGDADADVTADEGAAAREPFCAVGPLVNGLAVCDGYARAYQLLLGRIGIGCMFVASDEMNHSWNLVSIDGAWYHVDVTWDDPVPDAGPDARVRGDAFLRGDEAMRDELDHYGWAAPVQAPEDYPWLEQYGPLSYAGPADPATAEVATPHRFADVPADAWYVVDGSLDELVQAGVVRDEDVRRDIASASGLGFICPNDYLTRGWLARALLRLAATLPHAPLDTTSGMDAEGVVAALSGIVDCGSGEQPFDDGIAWCISRGLMTPYGSQTAPEGTRFGTYDAVTRAQLVVTLAALRAQARLTDALPAASDATPLASYLDRPTVHAEDAPAIQEACDAGLLRPRTAGDDAMLLPGAPATVADAAHALATVLRAAVTRAS